MVGFLDYSNAFTMSIGVLISSPFYEGIHEIVRNLVTT